MKQKLLSKCYCFGCKYYFYLFFCQPWGKAARSSLCFKNRYLLYKQTGGKRDYPCQGQDLIDDGYSTNETASHWYGSCSEVPLRGTAIEADRNDPFCCQNLHVTASIKKDAPYLLSLSPCCQLMPCSGNETLQGNNS
jgi:hypothetical protein